MIHRKVHEYKCPGSSVHRPTYGDEEYAPKQGAGQRRLDNLLQADVAGLVTFDQGCDVEGHLGDGAERGVHQRTHRKVTLGRDTAETTEVQVCVACTTGAVGAEL